MENIEANITWWRATRGVSRSPDKIEAADIAHLERSTSCEVAILFTAQLLSKEGEEINDLVTEKESDEGGQS